MNIKLVRFKSSQVIASAERKVFSGPNSTDGKRDGIRQLCWVNFSEAGPCVLVVDRLGAWHLIPAADVEQTILEGVEGVMQPAAETKGAAAKK